MNPGEDRNKGIRTLNETIIDRLGFPACILGVDGTLRESNRHFTRLFSPERNDIRLDLGHPFFPEYRKQVAQSYLNALEGNNTRSFAMLQMEEGEPMAAEIYLYPLFEENEVLAILALIRPVDNRLLSFDRTTSSLIDEDDYYENLNFEFSPLAILRVTEGCQVIRCSHTFETLTGFNCKQLIENSDECRSLFLYDFDRVKKIILDILSGSLPFYRMGEVKIQTLDKVQRIVNMVFYPIVIQNKIEAVEILMEDLTNLKSLEERIATMEKIGLISDITQGFLHSLNNTINIILSQTQLLSQITEKEEVLDRVRLIEESSTGIVTQIHRFQNFISDGSEASRAASQSLIELIEDSIEFARMQFKVSERNQRKEISIERKYFSDVDVNVNGRSLRQLIIAMILNVAFTVYRSGTISITMSRDKDLVITVSYQKKPEDQVHQMTAEDETGILSGLNYRHLAEKLSIKIFEEESSEVYAVRAVIPSRMIESRKRDRDEIPPYRIRDLDILIVEDERALQKVLFEVFDRMGNRVYITENGSKALAEFRQRSYDLLITDYDVAGITGIELSARVKEINEKVTTILLSGWMLNDIDAYQNVIDLFIPKPFRLDDMIKKVSQLLFTKKS
jgi:CheY-like chemotaxis protein/nitrogen-specific signal transduction histidine kinase